jgi:hypothetical protein
MSHQVPGETQIRALGLRAEPDAFNWAVTEGILEAPILIAAEKVAAPNGYLDPEILSFVRTRLLHIIQTRTPDLVGLRTPEHVARGAGESSRRRLRLEGVLLATCGEAALAVTVGALVTVNSLLGSKSAKLFLNSNEFRGIDWSKYSPAKREAILMSASLLPKGADAGRS